LEIQHKVKRKLCRNPSATKREREREREKEKKRKKERLVTEVI
jgi:hypothetical protein